MKMHDAPATTVFRKEGHPYTWPVSLVPAKGKRWRYRGPHGWRSKIAATPAEAWALLAAALRTDGWTPDEPVRNPRGASARPVLTEDEALRLPIRRPDEAGSHLEDEAARDAAVRRARAARYVAVAPAKANPKALPFWGDAEQKADAHRQVEAAYRQLKTSSYVAGHAHSAEMAGQLSHAVAAKAWEDAARQLSRLRSGAWGVTEASARKAVRAAEKATASAEAADDRYRAARAESDRVRAKFAPRPNPGTKRPYTHATDVQTLLFDSQHFTPKEAKRWAKNHGFRYGKVDEGGPSATFIRLRQHAPDEYRKGTLRTITLDADQTIKAVIGVPLRAAAATRPEGYDSRGPRKNPHKPFKFHEHPRLSFRNATTGEPPTMAEWGEMVTRAHQIIDAWKYRSPEQLEWAARVDPAYYADVVVLGAAYGGPMGKPQ